MIELGIFKHVLTVIHARFAAAIHVMASVNISALDEESGWNRSRWCQTKFFRRWEYKAWSAHVWERLRTRLLKCGLSEHVAKAFIRHDEASQTGCHKTAWRGMAAHEVASLVKMLPFTLRDLLSPERQIVLRWRERCSGAPDAEEDPSEQIGDFLSRLLTWVSLISREALTEAMVADSDAQAKELMFMISAVFPYRRWNGQESSGDKWNFPKLHAMFHVADEIRR